ncbi:hypothetical protein G6F31_019676 [Rhizopus arrhizus]|nr:hypothetical protein G6F31_019676 [Rhizopus arrhizus]
MPPPRRCHCLRLHVCAATLGLEEQGRGGQQGHADTAAAEHQQELAALAIDQQQRDHGHHRIEQLDRHVGAVGHRAGQAGLVEDVHRIGQHRVDAGGLGTGQHHAGEQERDHIAAAEQRG